MLFPYPFNSLLDGSETLAPVFPLQTVKQRYIASL